MESGTLLHNRYRIAETLGRGGMGAVYRAIDDTLGVQVAVKENFFEDEEFTRQFRREATILANLRHPNLPRVTDHFVLPGQGQYLVMDYIEGEDLKARLDRLGVMHQNETILMGTAMCDALNYLHTHQPPILHRDIKPGNIKITSKGEVFLVDFGLAKIVQGTKKTTLGAQGLTPGFSPPEQYGSARTDGRSDIYSLSATMYVSLTGVSPEESLSQMMEKTSLTPIRKHNPKVSEEVEKAIHKGLAIQPEDRYQTAAEYREALLQVSTSAQSTSREKHTVITPSPEPDGETRMVGQTVPVGSGKVTVLNKGEEEKKGFPKSLIVGFALILTAIVVGVFFLPKFINPESDNPNNDDGVADLTSTVLAADGLTPAPGETEIETTQDSATDETVQATETIEVTPIGGGGQIAFASERSGLPQIWLINVDGSDLIQLTDDQGGACQPDWAPDGTKLVFVSPCPRNQDAYPGSSLFVINADGSGLTVLPTFPGGDYNPSWSPDGESILFTSIRAGGRPQIWVLNLGTNQTTNLSDSVARDFQPIWSPDGNSIGFTTTRLGSSQIWFMDTDGEGQNFFSRSDEFENSEAVWSPNGEIILFTQRGTSGGITWLSAATWEDGGSSRGFNEFLTIGDAGERSRNPMREADYSPDGIWLVISNNPGGDNHDIYIMTSSGASMRRLTIDPAADFDPNWRPKTG